MKKLFAATAVAISMSIGLSGCYFSQKTLEDTPVLGYEKTFSVQDQDQIMGFVIQQKNNQLIMLGNKFVYVFDEESKCPYTCHTDTLKQILQNPQFLQLKQMSWTTSQPGLKLMPNTILLKSGNKFRFRAQFQFTPQNEKEFAFLKQMNFIPQEDTPTKIGRRYEQQLNFDGKIYEHNESTRQLLKNAKPLSKNYQFDLLSSKTERPINGENLVKRIFVLPFAVVGDIILFPLSTILAAYRDAGI